MKSVELNFDGIVGPTHNYSGLSHGNVASVRHKHLVSSPRRAALQGLEKMKFVAGLGIEQAVLPPARRPRVDLLRQLGFIGEDDQVLQSAFTAEPSLLAAAYSASCMWTANAATVSPSADTSDKRVHLTPANLSSGIHRSVEAETTFGVLQFIFSGERHFKVHAPLPSARTMSDEGAANHTRLANDYGTPGLELFVFGRSDLDQSLTGPKAFPARQTLEASRAISRLHQLGDENTVFIQQNPQAIDSGVFHNDVISVGNLDVLIAHQYAFVDQGDTLDLIREKFRRLNDRELHVIELSEQDFPVNDAVNSYLFNSQILSPPGGPTTLLCPNECREIESAQCSIERIVADDGPIQRVEFLDLRQSMNNGGGPACLRLRVVLSDIELKAIHQGIRFTDGLYQALVGWVNRHYRDELSPDDLRDPALPMEVDLALLELADILSIPQQVLLQ